MSDRKLLPGKFVWFEHVSGDGGDGGSARKAQAFYGEVLGWRTQAFPMGPVAYEMIYVGDTMIGGYAAPKIAGQASHWISYVSVEDVDAAAKAAAAHGGKVIEPAQDIPGVGRRARIADPQGAELALFKRDMGDLPDAPAPHGGWVWNELHVSDPASVAPFYEAVAGLSCRAMEMGPGRTYRVFSRGGVDRGGLSPHLMGAAPRWLPYVCVDDVDDAVGRARKLAGTIVVGPEDIPGVGRFAVLEDPAGATLAVMRPLPREPRP